MSTTSTNERPELAVVIMAGGAGTRFWPVSTERTPKQFLRLVGERTMIQQAYDRVAGLVPPERVLVLTNARFGDLVREQLPELPEANIIGEPMRRDTAAAVALAAALVRHRFGDPVMAVLTADHHIEPVARFQAALLSAARGAREAPGALYTFGIPPAFPATGYGYLRRGDELRAEEGATHYRLLGFREKPDLETARAYVDSGEYSWNSGMFVWTTGAIIGQLERHLPDHLRLLAPAVARDGQPGFGDALREAFAALPSISIDYGVMEKADEVRCVVSDFGWNDVGGWLALRDYLPREEAGGNHHRGHVHIEDARDNIVFCEDPAEHVALVGVRGLVVVRAGDRTLVVHQEATERIKALVKALDEELR